MVLAVQLNRERQFDALWNWSNTFMLILTRKIRTWVISPRSMNTDGTPRDRA